MVQFRPSSTRSSRAGSRVLPLLPSRLARWFLPPLCRLPPPTCLPATSTKSTFTGVPGCPRNPLWQVGFLSFKGLARAFHFFFSFLAGYSPPCCPCPLGSPQPSRR